MELIQHKNKWYIKSNTGYREVLATTDKSLTIGEENSWKNRKDILYPNTLPEPSQVFLEKYCKVGGIDEVLVECEEYYPELEVETIEYIEHTLGIPIEDFKQTPKYKIKINPDNTIIIHPIKNSWSREEVIDLINKHTFEFDGKNRTVKELNEWENKNL